MHDLMGKLVTGALKGKFVILVATGILSLAGIIAIRASIDNSSRKLRPEMFGHIVITVGHETALTIPKEALQTIGEAQVVFIREGSKYTQRKVTPGNEVDNFVEITSGLKAGDEIVTTGSIDLLGKVLQSLKQ